MKKFDFIANNGVEYLVRTLGPGDKYGKDDKLTFFSEIPVIEFHHKGGNNLISSYSFSVFLNVQNGILLEGSEPKYSLNEEDMVVLNNKLDELYNQNYLKIFKELGENKIKKNRI